MPRRNPTRVDHLAEAISLFHKAGEVLAKIDLRGVNSELRVYIRDSRDIAAEGVEIATEALRLDAPTVQHAHAKAS